jgi:tetratricopeptide (TPR) repeat protein
LMEISSSNTNTTSQEQDDDLGIRGVLLHNIATIHVDQGEHELALEEFREALRIKQIAGGEHNPEVAKTLNSLGALHAGVFNDKLQALDYFKQALLIARIHVDNDHDTDIMNALQNISLMEQDLYGERQS